jgi:hypothetical protein
MHDSVYQCVRSAQDANGRRLINVENDAETLPGKPAYVSPSIPLVGGSPVQNGVIMFGALGCHHIRRSKPTIQKVLNSSTNGIEKGKMLIIGRIGADSFYFDPSAGQAPPIIWATVTN